MQVPHTAAEAVAQGAQLLDEKLPGWYKLIDKLRLQISSCGDCVCGQLAPVLLSKWELRLAANDRFMEVGRALDPSWDNSYYDGHLAVFYGFDQLFPHFSYEQLEQEWVAAIDARLAADAIVEQVTEREAVLA